MFMNCNFNSNLLENEAGRISFPWARPCDGCHAAPSAVYCCADAAYLCASCDTQVHSANRVASRHERVRVCETCESAPAVLACHADAAALCTACDAQVHSANPIAQRHQRVPVLPLPAVAIPAASGFAEAEASVTAHGDKEEGEEVDSWRLRRNSDDNNCANKIDRYYNLVGYNMYYNNITCDPRPEEQYRMQEQHVQNRYIEKQGCECVVPPQVVMASEQQESDYGTRGAGQAASVTAITSTYTASISNDVSFSSMEVGIIPDNTRPDISNSNILTGSEAMELSGHSLQMPVHFSSMDREARVLRYKEKKQTRKFQKTIRYATRKAYAEARPRIKGRFAKRSDIEHEEDHMLSPPALPDTSSYNTVPWF
ncbi:zinc finger protein HD1-like [Triticum urartu]|uniref:Zinc finger protein CONSTANS-LIKE 2 n=1 Tax=Triticum urartu TaxID=4572 RepID=A0A8R7UY01_TRIUA|nr:zinc finger protein HD1-like [Triticum urartu]